MRNFLIGLWKDEDGAAAAEYALILAVIAVGIAIFAGALGDIVGEAIELACEEIKSGSDEFATDCAGTAGG